MASPIIHFVISAPRSGSTWLASALNYHPDIFATEHRLFGDFCEMWPNNNGMLRPRLTLDSFASALAVHYFHDALGLDRRQFVDEFQKEFAVFICEFARLRSGKRLVVDKITPYPGTTRIVVQKINRFFPESKIIHLIRDGRDVVTSGAFDWLLKDAHGTDRYKYFVQRDPGVTLKRFFDDQILTQWATHWRDVNRVIVDSNVDLSVSYEAMTIDQPAELQKIFETLLVVASIEVANNAAAESSFEKMTGAPQAAQCRPQRRERESLATGRITLHDTTENCSIASPEKS